jgi:outer membrane immunogenic protein
MRQTVHATALASLILAMATPSLAADLPRRTGPRDDYYPPQTQTVNWQGLYLGVNAGYGFGAFQSGSSSLIGNPSGGLIGFTGGYNYVVAPNLLVGLEADFDFAGMKASQIPFFGLASNGHVDDLFTLRGRVGYTVDRAMAYVTGGFAGSRNTVQLSNYYTNFYGQQSQFQTGWALGGGIEFMLTNNLSAKGEYIFTSVGNDRYFDFSQNALQTGVNNSTVKGGLNYHF